MSVSETLSSNGFNGNINGHSSLENSFPYPATPEGQMPRDDIRKSASETIDGALQVPFLQRLNGRLVAESGELINTALEFVLDDETVTLRSSQTHIGRELWIGASNGFISLSDKEIAIVDVKKDGELYQSTAQSAKIIDQFLAEISDKIGDIDPQVPMTPQSEVQVIRV